LYQTKVQEKKIISFMKLYTSQAVMARTKQTARKAPTSEERKRKLEIQAENQRLERLAEESDAKKRKSGGEGLGSGEESGVEKSKRDGYDSATDEYDLEEEEEEKKEKSMREGDEEATDEYDLEEEEEEKKEKSKREGDDEAEDEVEKVKDIHMPNADAPPGDGQGAEVGDNVEVKQDHMPEKKRKTGGKSKSGGKTKEFLENDEDSSDWILFGDTDTWDHPTFCRFIQNHPDFNLLFKGLPPRVTPKMLLDNLVAKYWIKSWHDIKLRPLASACVADVCDRVVARH
jgi:hypothetical protein